jgi:hypothetical protein
VKRKEAMKTRIADRAEELLRLHPIMAAKKLKDQLQQQFTVQLSYGKVCKGMQSALQTRWEDSFRRLSWRQHAPEA